MSSVRRRAANDNGQTRDLISKLAEAVEKALTKLMPSDLPFENEEVVLLAATNEAVRRALQRSLQERADGFADEVYIGGKLYRRHQPGTARYFSLSGPMDIKRWTYRRVGERNGRTKIPMDCSAGLVFGATPALAYAVAQGHAKHPVRVLEADMIASHRRPPSKSTMDRLARQLGAYVNDAVEDIEPIIRATEAVPRNAVGINIGLDRTTAPLEEVAESEDGSSLATRIVVAYRMAYVGTVCLTDADGDAIWTRKYAAPAHEGPDRLLERVVADLRHALGAAPGLNVGIVQDGAPELWFLIWETLQNVPELKKKRWRETVDRFHLMQRLAKVLEILIPDDEAQRRARYEMWNAALNQSDGAIKEIERWLIEQQHPLDHKTFNKVATTALTYIGMTDHFRYASLPALGLHQGSGVTEGACKSLIKARVNRSGQRWRMPGLSSVLALRTLHESARLPAFWRLFAKRFHAECMNAA